jgi:hypothetical protein
MKLRLALGLGAFALFSWVLVPVTAQAQLDHYKCYQGKDLKNPKFLKVDGVSTQNKDVDKVVRMIRGKPNTPVRLTVRSIALAEPGGFERGAALQIASLHLEAICE